MEVEVMYFWEISHRLGWAGWKINPWLQQTAAHSILVDYNIVIQHSLFSFCESGSHL